MIPFFNSHNCPDVFGFHSITAILKHNTRDRSQSMPCADPEGGGKGSGPPLENYKNIGFLCNTGPDSIKITKLPSQHSMLGHHRRAIKTPFKRRFAGGLGDPPIVVFGSFLPSSS